MVRRVVALGFVLLGSAWAGELSIKNLSVPEFDAAGGMTRRLTAESATGGLMGKSQLKDGRVEFFEAKNSAREVIATLDFKDAAYDRSPKVVDGAGLAVLRSTKGDVGGRGFIYDIGRNHLTLKSAVTIDHNGVHLAGNTGEVFLAESPSSKMALIKEATLKGGIVVSGILDSKLAFEKAESERAVYTASDETIVLDSPVYVWRKGVRRLAEGDHISIYVGKGTKPAAGVVVPAGTGQSR